jgi:hypothetical protein
MPDNKNLPPTADHTMDAILTRRKFLQLSGPVFLGGVLNACAPFALNTVEPKPTQQKIKLETVTPIAPAEIPTTVENRLENTPYPTTSEGFDLGNKAPNESLLATIQASDPESFEWMRTATVLRLWRDKFPGKSPETPEALFQWFDNNYTLEGVISNKAWAITPREKSTKNLLTAWVGDNPLLQLMPLTVPIGDYEAIDKFTLKPVQFGDGVTGRLVADKSGHVVVAGVDASNPNVLNEWFNAEKKAVFPTETAVPSLGYEVRDGRIYDTQTGNQVEYVGFLPDKIRMDRVEEAKFINDKNEDKGKILLGYDSKGRLMMVRPDGQDWMVAPYGKALVDGVWRVFEDNGGGVRRQMGAGESYNKMSSSAELDSIAEIVTSELLNDVGVGELGPFSSAIRNAVEVKLEFKGELFDKMLEAWGTAPVNEQYWSDMGVSDRSAQGIKNWLAKSIGSDGKPNWLPATSPNGFKFGTLTSIDSFRASVGVWGKLQVAGGMYLDNLPYITVSLSEFKSNSFANAYITSLIRRNKVGDDIDSYVWFNSTGKEIASMWGVMLQTLNGSDGKTQTRPIVVMIDESKPGFSKNMMFEDNDGVVVGNSVFIATAKYMYIVEAIKNYRINDLKNPCIDNWTTCDVPLLVDIKTISETYFEAGK